jgi:hypothetical protein
MPIPLRYLGRIALPLVLLLGGGAAALAQGEAAKDPELKLIQGGGTPSVFGPGRIVLPANSCPAIVDTAAGEIQPMRLPPADVAAKNRLGCLSPNDAIYGADGCPLRLCGGDRGTVPLPAAGGPAATMP